MIFGKPVPTSPDHAPGSDAAAIAATPARLPLRLEDVAVEDRRDTEIRHVDQFATLSRLMGLSAPYKVEGRVLDVLSK